MEKHKILVFGNKTFGQNEPEITSELFDITFQHFPYSDWQQDRRISEYSVVIMDYAVFEQGGSVYDKDQEIFEKQLFEALNRGTTICFLHYDEEVPGFDPYNYDIEYMDKEDVDRLLSRQLGFRFLNLLSIKPVDYDQPIHWGEIKRTEFKNFLDKWGSSKNTFVTYGDGAFGDLILLIGKSALAFSNSFIRGLLIYLPCQRNFENINDLTKMFQTLIDNLITYITRLRTEIPDWAKEPFFTKEKLIFKGLQKAEAKVEEIRNQIRPYHIAKSLAFTSSYELEKELPKFLKERFELNIRQSETFNEDFWLLDSAKKQIAICEIKSRIKGFSKSCVYDIYNHREHYDLDESFPAILFVNLNLNAPSWEQKLSPIAPQDYQVATQNNVLIVRIEDLFFMWDALVEKKITKENILKLLLTNKGWLKFNPDYNYEMKK